MVYIIIALLGLSVLIIAHEFGHFILAKLNGVKVEEFSLGMGPKIVGIKGGETTYLVKAFPIGGYVKMLGQEESVDDPRSFSSKSAIRRLSIIVAGPLMNVILAVLLFTIIGMGRGFASTSVDRIVNNSAAQKAGLKHGDQIVSINNKKVQVWDDISIIVGNNKNKPLDIKIKRNNAEKKYVLTPSFDKKTNRYMVGIYPVYIEKPSLSQGITYGYRENIFFVKQTFIALSTLFQGKMSANDVGGPVTMIRLSSQAAKSGVWTFMLVYAFFSIQLAIFNIIPFPALDGGWIFMLLFEIISRKKIDDKKVAVVNYIGFILLMVLMVVVFMKDIFFPVKL
ncbi:RIP metalloprotease RseP [Clostridium oryzae]|uniref:Zinc metalloprotease n=1 Tax=Clostridium oryzae TaxID=1450648 RepID=A0A1V4IPT2_9CLOT|nr:RIP metalloprotease RseP [Clostridium oryzae]OPJ61805.1 regulator of sigma-W protease RasP [Clostridium oryzae]